MGLINLIKHFFLSNVFFSAFPFMSGKSLSDREKKTSTQKVKYPSSFEIWIFRNGQPDCDDDRRIFVAMTSTWEQGNLAGVAFASGAELCPVSHCTGHKL
jgi:hypothetical protein